MRLLVCFLLTTFLASVLFAEERTPATTSKKVAALIDQLASPNPPPTFPGGEKNGGPDYILPAGFSRAKQMHVYEACHQLKTLGPLAFPYLIKSWNDKRHSMTLSVGINGYCFNASVGEICERIIFDQLQPYGTLPEFDDDPRGKPHRPSYPAQFLATPKDAGKWYEEHKNKTLFEMQLMIVEWVIEQESKSPTNFLEKEHKEVRRIRDQLKKAAKPIDRGNYYSEDTEA